MAKVKGQKSKVKSEARVITILLTAFFSVIFIPSVFADDYSIVNNLFFDDFGKIGSAVSSDWLTTGLITASLAAGTAAVMYNDENLRLLLRDNSGKTGDFIFDTANYLGDPLYILAADTLLFLGGPKERKTAQKVMEAMAIAGLINYAGKVVLGRERPSAGSGPYSYKWFDLSDNAMPSGHTCTAFAWATVVGDAYNIGYITYPLAAMVGVARVYKNAHWPSDVLIGAAIGILTAKAITFDGGDLKLGLYDGGIGLSYVY